MDRSPGTGPWAGRRPWVRLPEGPGTETAARERQNSASVRALRTPVPLRRAGHVMAERPPEVPMSPFRPLSRRALAPAGLVAGLLLVALAGTVQAHIVKSFGAYTVALGWVHEPTYVGQLNAVQAFVTDSKGKPVNDLAAGDLKVIVTAGGQDSASLELAPTYDADTGLGTPGDYEAPIVPTIPGDYTFHLSGTIHGIAVDETATSSESTFNSAADSTSIDFPAKLPSLSDIATRLDRIDARASAVPSAAPAASSGPDPAIAAAQAVAAQAQTTAGQANDAATRAQDSASTALTVGGVVGAAGVVIGLIALFIAFRTRRPSGS